MEVLAFVILAIVVLIGALCLAFAIYIRTSHCLLVYRSIRQMRQKGRFLSKSDFKQRLEASAGTAILEYPTLGWRVLRIWWTPDDVLSLAQSAGISDRSPDSEGHTPSPLEAWIHDNYTDLQHGHAAIVPHYLFGAAFQNFGRSLRSRFPSMPSAPVRSAAICFFRDENIP